MPKKVIIIGAGNSGLKIAAELDKDFDVTVVERNFSKKHFFNIGALRAAVVPGYAKNIFIPFNKALKRGKVLWAEATDITRESVTIKRFDNEGEIENLAYDYLILATGAAYTFPARVKWDAPEAELLAQYDNLTNKVKEAESVLIIGGGPVGIELAGEIRAVYPTKKITMVQSGSKLVEGPYAEEFRKKLTTKLKEHKIDVIYNEKVQLNATPQEFDGLSRKTLKTDKGREIESDIQFVCVGNQPNSNLYKGIKILSAALDNKGRIKVNQYLQVEGFENIFCIGDLTNTQEPKSAASIMGQVSNMKKNISAISSGKPLKAYKAGGIIVSVIPIGPNDGVSQLPGIGVWGGNVTTKLKSKSLFVDSAWKQLNASKPN